MSPRRFGGKRVVPHKEGSSYRARSAFNRYSSITRRAFAPRTNCRDPYRLGLFVLSNLISRREVHRKQGLPLGDASELVAVPEHL